MAKVEKKLTRRSIEAQEDAVIDFQFALIDLLKHLGITREQLAERLGVTKSRVSQLFGDNANPTLKQVARVLDALDYKLQPRFNASKDKILAFEFERVGAATKLSPDWGLFEVVSAPIIERVEVRAYTANDNPAPALRYEAA